jgi:hypothetical protein
MWSSAVRGSSRATGFHVIVVLANAVYGQSASSGSGRSSGPLGNPRVARPGIQARDLDRSIGANRAASRATRSDPYWSQMIPPALVQQGASLDERSPLFNPNGSDEATTAAGRPVWSNAFRGLPSSDVSRQSLGQFRDQSNARDTRDPRDDKTEGREPEAIVDGPYADPRRPELREVTRAHVWWQAGGARLASGTARAASQPVQSTADNPILRRSPAEVHMDQLFSMPHAGKGLLEAKALDR